jgi:predicted P-loop ATPase
MSDYNDIPTAKPEKSKAEKAEDFLRQEHVFRYNVIKCRVEVAPIENPENWRPIDDRDAATFLRRMDALVGFRISKALLAEILTSDFSPAVNPITEYFNNLPKWDRATNPIEDLGNTVKVIGGHEDAARWQNYLKRWMVATVANALTPHGCQNHTALILSGGQGTFKTTWLENLCPDVLRREYLYSGPINPENKDSQTFLAERFIINIDDQLHTLHKKNREEIKNMITLTSVKYRRPYDKYIQEYPRIASFCGSVNGIDFLSDTTGSRRFLPFEIEEIDIKAAQAFDLDAAWSQAMTLWHENFKYWFSAEEQEELNEHNQQFTAETTEETLLLKTFKRPVSLAYAKHLGAAEIINELLKLAPHARLSERTLGSVLKKNGFEKKQVRQDDGSRVWGYYVELRDNREFIPPNDGDDDKEPF